MTTLKNSVRLTGNLGADIEVKTFESGKMVGSTSIATNESYMNAKGEKVTETQWANLIFWGKLAENAAKLTKKGSFITIEGKLINRSFESNGVTKYVTEIQVREFLILDKKSAEAISDAEETGN